MAQGAKGFEIHPPSSLLRKTAWNAVAGFSSASGRFLVGIFVARLLGPNGLGRLAYLLWIVDLVATLCSFGFQNSLTRFAASLDGKAEYGQMNSLIGWISRRYLALGGLGMIVVGLVAGATTQGADREFIIWGVLIAYFGIQALGALYLAYLAGIQRFDAIAKLNILSTLLLVCSVGWGAYSWGLVGVLCGYLAGGILPAGIGLYTFIRSLKNAQVSADLSKRVTRYAIYTWFTAIVAFFVWSRAEILFLKFFWNDRLVAMFTVSLGLVSLITQGQSLLSGALLPHFVNKADSDNKLAIENTFVLTTRIFAFLFFPACLGIAAILPWLLPMLYGEAFRDAVPFSMALVAATGFTAVGAPASIMIFAMEKPKFHFVSNAVSAFLILAFSTITIGHWGLTGAVAQRLVVQVSLVFLSFFYIARRLRIDVPWRSIFIILISSIVGLLPLFVFSHYFNPIGSVFMGVALFLLLYMFMLYLFGAISQDDWKFFRQTYLHEIGFPKRRAS